MSRRPGQRMDGLIRVSRHFCSTGLRDLLAAGYLLPHLKELKVGKGCGSVVAVVAVGGRIFKESGVAPKHKKIYKNEIRESPKSWSWRGFWVRDLLCLPGLHRVYHFQMENPDGWRLNDVHCAGGGVEGWHWATLGHRLRPHRPWLQIRAPQLRDDASCAGTRRAGQELPAARGGLGAAGGEATPGQCAGRWQLHCYLPVLCSGGAASATATTAAEISRQVDSQGDHISLWLWSRHCRSDLNSCGCQAENQRPVTTYSLFQAVCNLHVGAKLPNQTWPTVQMVEKIVQRFCRVTESLLQHVMGLSMHLGLFQIGDSLGFTNFSRDSGVQNWKANFETTAISATAGWSPKRTEAFLHAQLMHQLSDASGVVSF